MTLINTSYKTISHCRSDLKSCKSVTCHESTCWEISCYVVCSDSIHPILVSLRKFPLCQLECVCVCVISWTFSEVFPIFDKLSRVHGFREKSRGDWTSNRCFWIVVTQSWPKTNVKVGIWRPYSLRLVIATTTYLIQWGAFFEVKVSYQYLTITQLLNT